MDISWSASVLNLEILAYNVVTSFLNPWLHWYTIILSLSSSVVDVKGVTTLVNAFRIMPGMGFLGRHSDDLKTE